MAHAPESMVLQQPWELGCRRLLEDTNPVSLPDPPRDFVIWSLFNVIFANCFCCMGFLAVLFSVKSRDRKMVGDMEGAQHYGATAKLLNIISTTFLGLFVTVVVSLVIWVMTQH